MLKCLGHLCPNPNPTIQSQIHENTGEFPGLSRANARWLSPRPSSAQGDMIAVRKDRFPHERRQLTIRKAEYATRREVGMICPPPLWIGSPAITASKILNFTFLIAVSIKLSQNQNLINGHGHDFFFLNLMNWVWQALWETWQVQLITSRLPLSVFLSHSSSSFLAIQKLVTGYLICTDISRI